MSPSSLAYKTRIKKLGGIRRIAIVMSNIDFGLLAKCPRHQLRPPRRCDRDKHTYMPYVLSLRCWNMNRSVSMHNVTAKSVYAINLPVEAFNMKNTNIDTYTEN
jgi:hypothetical protein